MITDIQKDWLQKELDGKVKRKQNPRKHSAYKRRIRDRIDHMVENLLWLAKNRPDILQDMEYELGSDDIVRFRRARALLQAIALFENEPTVLSLIAEIYTSHQIEVTKKK